MKRYYIFLAILGYCTSIGYGQEFIFSTPDPRTMQGATSDDMITLNSARVFDMDQRWRTSGVMDIALPVNKTGAATLAVTAFTTDTHRQVANPLPVFWGKRSYDSYYDLDFLSPISGNRAKWDSLFGWYGSNRDSYVSSVSLNKVMMRRAQLVAQEFLRDNPDDIVFELNFDVNSTVKVAIQGAAELRSELGAAGIEHVKLIQMGYTRPLTISYFGLETKDTKKNTELSAGWKIESLNYNGSYTPPPKIAVLKAGQKAGMAEVVVPANGIFYVAATSVEYIPKNTMVTTTKPQPATQVLASYFNLFTANKNSEKKEFRYYALQAPAGTKILFDVTENGPFVVAGSMIEHQMQPSNYALSVFNDAARYPNYTVVAAHRGYWADAGISENTIPSCQAALELGADMLEVDVRLSGDNIPMLLHDPCLHGTSTSIKTETAAQLKMRKTYDRFGTQTSYNINSLEQLLDALGSKSIITIDIKDENLKDGIQHWDNCFKACLQLVKNKGLLQRVIIKGSKRRAHLQALMNQVQSGLDFGQVQYTPVVYGDSFWEACIGGSGSGGSGGSGGDGTADGSGSGGSGSSGGQFDPAASKCFTDFKEDWYALIIQNKINAVETHFKVSNDPIIRSGLLQWLQDHGVRIGIFAFTADETQGVRNTTNDCVTNIREYFHDDPAYTSNQKPDRFNDGRGNLDFIYQKSSPGYIIHDRPDVVLSYLKAAQQRDLTMPVIVREALPDSALLLSNDGMGTRKMHRGFEGIALRISDVHQVEFFTPDTRNIPVKAEIVRAGENLPIRIAQPNLGTTTYLINGVTPSVVNQRYFNNRTYTGLINTPETCASIYGGLTTTLDERGAPFSSKFKFPHRSLAEWSQVYPGYDIYMNSNYWATDGLTGKQTASERPEFWLPCTDVYGLWVSNGVKLSNWTDPHDPSSRTENGCEKDENDQCIAGTQFDGRFDAFVMYTDGSVEIVVVDQLKTGYLDLVNLRRTSDQMAIQNITSGYSVARNGSIIDASLITKKFNNDQPEKMRTIIGLNGDQMYVISVQEPQLEVTEVADLMLTHYGCKDVMINDSGRSTAVLTTVGNFPNITKEAYGPIKAGTTPNGLDDGHLKQFFGTGAPQVYRNIGAFMAIRKK